MTSSRLQRDGTPAARRSPSPPCALRRLATFGTNLIKCHEGARRWSRCSRPSGPGRHSPRQLGDSDRAHPESRGDLRDSWSEEFTASRVEALPPPMVIVARPRSLQSRRPTGRPARTSHREPRPAVGSRLDGRVPLACPVSHARPVSGFVGIELPGDWLSHGLPVERRSPGDHRAVSSRSLRARALTRVGPGSGMIRGRSPPPEGVGVVGQGKVRTQHLGQRP